MKLSSNKVLITGGNKGIGFALARKFLALGNEVIVTGRNESDLHDVKHKFPNLHIFRCDLSRKEGLDQLVSFVANEHADLNVLINNAGVQYRYDVKSAPDLLIKSEEEVEINFLVPIKITWILLPLLMKNKNCAIVNVSSGLGFVPKKSAPVYCGTKAGIHMFTKALRDQLQENIKVFEVIPPLVDTAMTAGRGAGKISPDDLAEEFIRGFSNDKIEMNIGKVKMLRLLHRVFPALAEVIMRNR
jgi:short-subunit dehydrogenase involved in D-alanine esterification of teichoic acids